MLINSNYVKTFLALPSAERRSLQKLFKSYDETKRAFPSYNARECKYTAIEFTYQQYYLDVLNGLYTEEE